MVTARRTPTRRTPGISNFLFTLAALACVAPAASAQLLPVGDQPERQDRSVVTQPAEADALIGQGRIVFVRDREDTGEIFDTEMGHVEFHFRNIGGGPLTITSVKPSCGCTVPELQQTVFAPDETGTIKVVFDPKGKKGNLARNITVFTDSLSTPSTTIVVGSHVKPVVVVEPQGVVNFAMLDKGQGGVQDIRVLGRFPEFEVTRASTDDPMNFDIEVIPGSPVEYEGETLYEQTVRVHLKDTAKPGQLRASVSIRTNEERRPIFSVSAVGRIMGDLQLSPARLTLGRLTVGDEFEREIHVTSRSGKPFELLGANMSNPAVLATFTVEPVDPETKTEWILKTKGKVLSAASRFNTVVTLLSDVPDEETSEIQMYGQLRPAH